MKKIITIALLLGLGIVNISADSIHHKSLLLYKALESSITQHTPYEVLKNVEIALGNQTFTYKQSQYAGLLGNRRSFVYKPTQKTYETEDFYVEYIFKISPIQLDPSNPTTFMDIAQNYSLAGATYNSLSVLAHRALMASYSPARHLFEVIRIDKNDQTAVVYSLVCTLRLKRPFLKSSREKAENYFDQLVQDNQKQWINSVATLEIPITNNNK